jgi:hypothetical protein
MPVRSYCDRVVAHKVSPLRTSSTRALHVHHDPVAETIMVVLDSSIMARRLQVYLDEQDLARLEAWARGRGWTKSQAIRAAVRALTRPPDEDPLLELSGDIDGLPPDLSERFERSDPLSGRRRAR